MKTALPLLLIFIFLAANARADTYYARTRIASGEPIADQVYVPIAPNHARAYPRQVVEQFLFDYGGAQFYCLKGYPCKRKPLIDRYGHVTPTGIKYTFFYRAVPEGYDFDPNDYSALNNAYYRHLAN